MSSHHATGNAHAVANSWKWARAATVAMLVAAIGAAVVRLFGADRANGWVRFDTVGITMLVLVSFIGWVIVRYSEAYLAGDPHERRYVGLLLATLAAVVGVVIANNLLLLMLAWAATSLVLHGLLTFYRDRPVAMVVAHKKFILARCADLCMLGAIVAFGSGFKTLRIDEIAAQASASASLPMGARFGVALIVVAALLKCAQLPFHGWLIQVMEAPTPVSALLHAGVVNLGGFVLLRFAPVVDRVVEARVLLVGVGTTTAVLAAIVMTTRISIKVSLAWSTCAQMGFMLMQCGLGMWEMALMHIVAHSLYKAHAFLGAGGVVRLTQRKQLVAKAASPTVGGFAVGLALAGVGTFVSALVWGQISGVNQSSATMWILGGIVAMALVPLLSPAASDVSLGAVGKPGWRLRSSFLGAALLVPFSYFGLHVVFASIVPHGTAAPFGLLVAVVVGFGALFATQLLCAVSPNSSLVRRLYPWFYGGLFLDEAFTRVAFAVWPPPAPEAQEGRLPVHVTSPLSVAWSPSNADRGGLSVGNSWKVAKAEKSGKSGGSGVGSSSAIATAVLEKNVEKKLEGKLA